MYYKKYVLFLYIAFARIGGFIKDKVLICFYIVSQSDMIEQICKKGSRYVYGING